MLKDKVIVITGASTGIGAEMAKLFARKDARLVLIARSFDKLNRLLTELKGNHQVYALDVTNTEQVTKVMNEVISKNGKVDILINNAGFGVFDSVMDAKLSDIEEMMNVNYMGMVHCVKSLLPEMIKQKKDRSSILLQ